MSEEQNKPNILYFFTDQQRWDTVGCYGQPLDVTPNLDRMAQEGVRFENAFTCQPVCGPARSCIQTGKWATETGCVTNGIALPQDTRTLAHWMSDAGYEVAYIGKWHLASTRGEFDYRTKPIPLERRGGYKDHWLASDILEFTSHGYDGHMFNADNEKVEFKGYRVDCCTDFALDYLKSRKTDKPFFLFLSYIEPHHQNDHNRYEGPEGSKERFGDFEVPGDLVDTEGDWRENYPDYLGCINALDRNFGRLREELEEQGIADDTLIIWTSDHGSHFRTRNGEYKRACHDACTHIPMVISGPGFRGGKVCSELVNLIDTPNTVMKTAGLDLPDYMRGEPLQRLVAGDSEDWRDEVFIQISESHCGRAIRTHRWKYSVRAPDTGGGAPGSELFVEDFLYDLEADPHERNNLVDDPAYENVRAELRERLISRMEAAGEQEPEIRPSSEEEMEN
ncbi:MAG: sulfatase-like hydrolase/transferase [Planctomycetes bacterium]|nr:sulfatase-like hydrolase/transferase [Planctomycetota bacterium]